MIFKRRQHNYILVLQSIQKEIRGYHQVNELQEGKVQ